MQNQKYCSCLISGGSLDKPFLCGQRKVSGTRKSPAFDRLLIWIGAGSQQHAKYFVISLKRSNVHWIYLS